jgi:HEAT repeat protein
LRAALADRSADVRAAVLQEAATLPPRDAAGIVTLALRDPDPALRRRAEEASEALAAREPAAVVEALADMLQGGDAGARRAALVLFESIATRAPAACGPVLGRVVLADRTPDDARVAALLILRRTGPPSPSLKPALEKAIRPESSPRLRSAALPLYARLVSPAEAEEIARNEMKGPPAARASAAAVWGAVAITRPDEAAKALKAMLYDPSVETRVEAARAYGYLKRDGLELVDKALKDPSPEVERAALESATALAVAYPFQVAEILGRALKEVRPGVRRSLVEALARLGEGRPAVALPPLARAVKDSDAAARVAAANGFCALAKKNGAASAPFLRIAAKDDRDDVRTAAVACLADVAATDAKGAARIAAEAADSPTPAVRVAVADALAALGPEAAAQASPTLLKLIADSDPQVRSSAERAFAKGAGKLEGKRYADAERALEAALVQGDAAERKLIVSAAAKAGLWGLLRQAARDGDETVRLEAVRAAGAGKGVGLEIVRGAVDDRSQTVRAEAMRLLAGGAGGGARDMLPTFEAMLRGADVSARTAAVAGIGELPDAGEAGIRLLGEALGQRSEALRAAAARSLGRLAERDPAPVAPYLERAVRDVSYDVRNAALPVWRSRGRNARTRASWATCWSARTRQRPALRRAGSAGRARATAEHSGERARVRARRAGQDRGVRPLRWRGWPRASARASSTPRPPRCTRSSNACSADSARHMQAKPSQRFAYGAPPLHRSSYVLPYVVDVELSERCLVEAVRLQRPRPRAGPPAHRQRRIGRQDHAPRGSTGRIGRERCDERLRARDLVQTFLPGAPAVVDDDDGAVLEPVHEISPGDGHVVDPVLGPAVEVITRRRRHGLVVRRPRARDVHRIRLGAFLRMLFDHDRAACPVDRRRIGVVGAGVDGRRLLRHRLVGGVARRDVASAARGEQQDAGHQDDSRTPALRAGAATGGGSPSRDRFHAGSPFLRVFAFVP